jgi:hypothetical protein
MINRINTYEELLEEKARLKALLKVQTAQIQDDIRGIKEELKPITNITSSLSMFFTRKAGGLLGQLGVNLLADGLVRKVLLSRSGWIIRLVVPFLIKNFGSHIVDKPGKLLRKIKHLFGKNGKPGKPAQETGIDAV